MSRYIYYEIRGIQESRQQYQDFFVNMIRFSVIAFALILMLCLFLSYYIPLSITRPIRRLTQVTDQVAKGDLTVRSDVTGGLEARVLSDSMNTMIDKINELLEQVKTEQVRLRKAEFELLQSQINPHFLYNTLDAIVWLAEAGEQKKVVSMVGSLSDFFRISLNQGQDILDVREELQHVRSYLEIQQMRYQDILQYEICVPEELYSSRIPKITLQPLVENAVRHGIEERLQAIVDIPGALPVVVKGDLHLDAPGKRRVALARGGDNHRDVVPEVTLLRLQELLPGRTLPVQHIHGRRQGKSERVGALRGRGRVRMIIRSRLPCPLRFLCSVAAGEILADVGASTHGVFGTGVTSCMTSPLLNPIATATVETFPPPCAMT
jgi:HAMP domain-containing protein